MTAARKLLNVTVGRKTFGNMVTTTKSYEYWIPVTSEQHYLYAEEIARSLGLVTVKGALASRFVQEWAHVFLKENQIPPTFFYTARKALHQCYSPFVVMSLVSEIESALKEKKNFLQVIGRDGRTYKAIIEEEEYVDTE